MRIRETDTIAAVATGANGGVGIVRVSGQEALAVLQSVFTPRREFWTPRSLHFGTIVHPKTGEPLDQGLAAVFPQPRSYTGEDVVELHVHGGALNLSTVLQAVLAAGSRHAEPGEFTRRAFLNGKLDLTRAEAVLDVVHARTRAGLDVARAHLRGELFDAIHRLREDLMGVAARLEVNIDFVDDDVPIYERRDLALALERPAAELLALSSTFERGRLLRHGIAVALAGEPNVGKSSLFNALLREKRAIVTEIPGTTRDYLEEQIDVDGVPLVLVDTAGMRETSDAVERIGVSRSSERIALADVVLRVFDASLPPPETDAPLVPEVEPARCLNVLNKLDVGEHSAWAKRLPDAHRVSAATSAGLESLVAAILAKVNAQADAARPGAILTRARHRAAVERAHEATLSAADAIRRGLPYEIAAAELGASLDALGDVVGATTTEDLLDRVFRDFCIGK
jgi:tRNA modification GTPase